MSAESSTGREYEVGRYTLRTFRIDRGSGRLRSLTSYGTRAALAKGPRFRRRISGDWEGGVCHARCIHSDHKAPGPDCTCGIYSLLTYKELKKQYSSLADNFVAVIAPEGLGYMGPRGLRCETAWVTAYWAKTPDISAIAQEQWPEVEGFDDVNKMLCTYGFATTEHLCVTCGEDVGEERWSLGYRYCKKKDCVRMNKVPKLLVEIGQTKTNSIITTATPETLRAMKNGEFRRDPVVVGRQPSTGAGKVEMHPRPAKPQPVSTARGRLVQALQAQGCNPQQILEKGRNIGLTKSEVYKYMTGKRL